MNPKFIARALMVILLLMLLTPILALGVRTNNKHNVSNVTAPSEDPCSETTTVELKPFEDISTTKEETQEVVVTKKEYKAKSVSSTPKVYNYNPSTTDSAVPEPYKKTISEFNNDNLYYLAAAVCREAGGESEEIQLLVANVIMNRVNSTKYPNSICGVLTQRMQYGMMWKNGISFPSWATSEIKEQCYSVAQRVLNGERFCPENVLFQAEFKQGSGVYKSFDGFYFCYY